MPADIDGVRAVCVGPAVVLGLLAALAGCGKGAGSAPPPPEVMVAQVLQQKLIDWDEYTGRFQAIDTVEVRPRVSGYIDRVLFSEGKEVKKGETLIVIDPRPYQADYDRAKAELALAKAQRELAGLEAERVHKLKDSGAVSQEEYDERVSALHQQEASVAAAQAAFNSWLFSLVIIAGVVVAAALAIAVIVVAMSSRKYEE